MIGRKQATGWTRTQATCSRTNLMGCDLDEKVIFLMFSERVLALTSTNMSLNDKQISPAF